MKKNLKFGSKLPKNPPRSCGTVIPQRDFHSKIRNTPLFIEVSAQFYSRMCAHGHARSQGDAKRGQQKAIERSP